MRIPALIKPNLYLTLKVRAKQESLDHRISEVLANGVATKQTIDLLLKIQALMRSDLLK